MEQYRRRRANTALNPVSRWCSGCKVRGALSNIRVLEIGVVNTQPWTPASSVQSMHYSIRA